MNNIIIGTAGHVDHGKTCLIRALTGIDTDRLQEEKKRGITIELGFAYLDLPNGQKAGIIDVPGHEKFIKNMLAGAGGIDLVMLIVAADEGVMPQTVEHLGILSMLDLHRGVIVVTKSDTVEPDWLEMICEDIRERVAGTFLAQAPICCVSSYTGAGIPELRELLYRMIGESEGKSMNRPFRIPVDRVFSVEGFGTVITGTMIEGTLSDGQEVMLYPAQKTAKARNIQVHSADAEQAFAGQRTAVNLAGLKKDEVQRGDVLAPAGSMLVSRMVDVRLSMLPDTERTVKNNSRLHFYHGAREALCKVVLLDSEELTAGQSGYAQLRFEEDIAVKPHDHYVVRFYSPLETVGGGVVIDPCPHKHKRDPELAAWLHIRENGTPTERLEVAIAENSRYFETLDFAALQSGALPEDRQEAIETLLREEKIVCITDKIYLHADYVKAVRRDLVQLMNEFHKQYPLKAGVKREELRTRLLPRAELSHVDRLISYYIEKKTIKEVNGLISLFSFKVEVGEKLLRLTSEVEQLYKEGAFAPPGTDEVLERYKSEKNIGQLLSAMIADGTLVWLSDQIYMHKDYYEKGLQAAYDLIAEKGELVLSDYRDAVGTSRKFALALLEQFDRKKITRKMGDSRVLFK